MHLSNTGQGNPDDSLASAAGDGEMAQRIRSFDWSQSLLGPVSTWSPDLRSIVRLMLANRLPMLLWWGPQYVSIYNDPYIPVLGHKHPWALGQPVSECWKEIWHVLKPLIDTPFFGGPATWNEDILLVINRYGFNEETHWLIAYSPVPDASVPSGIGGVLATVHDATSKVLSERRMTALRDLASSFGQARTAEAACTAAARTLEAHDKDIPFALLYLINPDGIRADGQHAHLAATASVERRDLSPSIVELSADDRNWPFMNANRTMQPQVISDLGEWFTSIPPGPWPDPPTTALVLPFGSSNPNEPAGFFVAGISSHLRLDDAYRGFLDLVTAQIGTAIANATAFEEERRRVEALAELHRAKKQSEERMRLLWEAAAVLLTTDEPDTMLRQLFAKIGPHLKLDSYFNFMVNENGNGLKLASCIGISDEIARTIENLAFGEAVCGTVAVTRRPITATYIGQSDDPKVQLVKSFGIRAYACNPLMTGDELLGTLSFASRKRDEFDAEELDFLQTICRYIAAAYERLRLIGKLREADRRKDEFLATLAHELRNPLAPIRNGLQVLRLGGTTGEMANDARKMMERQLSQMVRLIDDLLDLSRISRGKIELKKERVELAKVVHHAIETSKSLIEQANHEFLTDVPTEPIYVDADVTRLSQVFSNLLNNAAKYTEPGGKIQLSVQRTGNEVAVCVRDNGVGIPADMQRKVFEMFTQVDRNLERSQGGLGIGLSIVKRLVEMHGGSIKVKSDRERMGSEFVVRLPAVASVTLSNSTDEPGSRTSARRRILVVDDNRDAAMSLAMMLNLMGNESKTAHDGMEALDIAAAFQPDLILLDIGMPRLNGHETAKRIREQPWGQRIVLVALTGWGQDEDRFKSAQAGFDSHMVKPVEPALLEKLLANLKAGTA